MELKILDNTGTEITRPLEVSWKGWSEQDYLRRAPESRTCEFVNGDVFVHAPASPRHQQVVQFLSALLTDFTRETPGGIVLTGPATVHLAENLYREPDVFWIPDDRRDMVKDTHVEGAPPFVIEVVSQASRTRDTTEKKEEYRKHGVGEYWILDPRENRAEVFYFSRSESVVLNGEGTIRSNTIPGFSIQLEWLLSDPLPPRGRCLQKINDSGE